MYKMKPVFRENLFLPAVNLPQHIFSILPGKRFQRLQTLPEFGQSHGNNGNALQMRQVPGQVPDGAVQLLSVIKALAKDNLSVHLNTRFIKKLRLFQSFPCKPIMQHPAPELRIRCLK